MKIVCEEGRGAISLLNDNYNYNVLAVDYSKTVIQKCNGLSNHKYKNNFRQFDIIKDKLETKFDFIYSIAVIHMFVSKKHRDIYIMILYMNILIKMVLLLLAVWVRYRKV